MSLYPLSIDNTQLILACLMLGISGTAALYIHEPPATKQTTKAGVFDSISKSRFEGLKVGMSVDEVVNHMGSQPSSIDATESGGSDIEQLTWTTLRGQRFVVRFVTGRLASKNLTT